MATRKAVITGLAGAIIAVGAGVAAVGFGTAPQQTAQASACKAPGQDTGVWYVMAYQCATGLKTVSATVGIPQSLSGFDACADHTNGQITLRDERGRPPKAIEVGWVTYPFGGPFLQIGRSVGGQNSDNDYPSIDFVSVSSDLPQPLRSRLLPSSFPISAYEKNLAIMNTEDAARIKALSLDLKITHADDGGGQWQVWVGGKELGYYPDSAFGEEGFSPQRASWWGEVQTKPGCSGASNSASCIAMGNGEPGPNQQSVGFSNLAIDADGKKLGREMYATDSSLYSSDQLTSLDRQTQPLTGDTFRYGGAGNCPPPPQDSPQTPVVNFQPKIVISPPRRSVPKKVVCASGQTDGLGNCVAVKKRRSSSLDRSDSSDSSGPSDSSDSSDSSGSDNSGGDDGSSDSSSSGDSSCKPDPYSPGETNC